MKRLFFLNLLAFLLFVSCASADNSSSYLIRAEESADIEERIGIYLSQIEENSDDMRAYYNLAYLYLYQEDYLKAEEILKRSISLFPEHFRFYSALLYLYERTGNEDKELETLYNILSFMYADEDVRNRILRILDKRDDERRVPFAEETLLYYPENQRAINILSEVHPYFETKAIKNMDEDDIRNYSLPLSKEVFIILVNPEGYGESILDLFSGTLLSQAE